MPYIMLKGTGHELITSHDYIWDGRNRTGDHCVLQYTLDGRGEIETGGRKHSLEPGDAFLANIPGDHIYRLPADSPRWEVLYFELSHLTLHLLQEWLDIHGCIFRIEPQSEVEHLLWATYREAIEDSYRDMYQCSRAAYSLAMSLASHLVSLASSFPLPPVVERCKTFIDSNLHRSIGLPEMAEASGCSKFHLTREFERKLGLSPGRYLTRIRLERAAVLLLEHAGITLGQVAELSGFSNANYFGKVFRKYTGIAPGEFRKEGDLYQIRRLIRSGQ
ncbi:AraC family transcriptional regulator [Paenibacillus rhizophilus]|uniref:AraC family transcriptional regulator n=1 Tax=Paenibacillus rhizophilus TaxID=1850366 RepID=A0A3N9PBX4_9BACL|nr:AraC family transcriptional regulator [Paenibacillus rhizophilus]RQW12747.1 AraC family transcriptional regulator [Paenibacillus rhizophilus]